MINPKYVINTLGIILLHVHLENYFFILTKGYKNT